MSAPEIPERIRLRLPGGWHLPPFGVHQLLAAMIVAVALWAVGALWLAMDGLGQWLGGWQEAISIHVYLDRGPERRQRLGRPEELDALVRDLEALAAVRDAQVVSPVEAARRMLGWLGTIGLGEAELAKRLPWTVELGLAMEGSKAEFVFDDIRDVAARHGATVNEVEAGLVRAHRWLGRLRVAAGFATLVLGLAMALIIANTLRMMLLARAEELALMRLMGASESFVRLPFVLEGIVLGAASGFAAWLLQWPLIWTVGDWLDALGVRPDLGWLFLPMLFGGALAGAAGAFIATFRAGGDQPGRA